LLLLLHVVVVALARKRRLELRSESFDGAFIRALVLLAPIRFFVRSRKQLPPF
jgi:hypothetical protein